ncbi:sacsin N-terminal ATP-binding-like domain-containing protein [Gimesia chilikensis]|uniref:Sacsin/Nov domain-containing protein n=1 Tax=Gimesia chilikensis TaxID=2605989 RepID=A0A517PY86_9PLAN|nr:hypothetical protein [Gimesia chilikensis]QDT24351.1 hypothetical protein HG66A1_61830 [Gimesia chilikensis]
MSTESDEMQKLLSDLSKSRQRWVDANKENNFSEGINNLLTELYPENAHFIYELLQNAEDVEASYVSFELQTDQLVVEHDGKRRFTFKDFESITSIGTSTKKDDPTAIGKFGVGFKAVFAYTKNPEIHSGDHHFRIHDLVVPDTSNVKRINVGDRTRFVFPFDHPHKFPSIAVEEIKRRLLELPDITLLFLKHISNIEFVLPNGSKGSLHRKSNSDSIIEIQSTRPHDPDLGTSNTQNNKHLKTKTNWLRFIEKVEIADPDKDYGQKECDISIAFHLERKRRRSKDKKNSSTQTSNSTWEITPLENGNVSIYFPAIKEISRLRFHINAPFASTVARDSVRECKVNEDLRDHLADLLAKSMTDIRDLGLLTPEFLGVLPVPEDNLIPFYAPLRKRLVSEFTNKSLTPTYYDSYAPAKTLIQSSVSLKQLLSKKDIHFLLDYLNMGNDRQEWVIGISQNNPRLGHFLSSLDISYIGFDDFVQMLEHNISVSKSWIEPDKELLDWLKSKPDAWIQSMYAFLYSELVDEYRFEELDSLLIVKMNDGSLGTGSGSYFPSDGDQNDITFPRTRESIYASGKKKKDQEKARKFLEEIGVREVGESDLIQSILDERYKPDKTDDDIYLNEIDDNILAGDIKRFIQFLEGNPRQNHLFKNYFLFETDEGRGARPSWVYLDTPFYDSGLAPFYESLKKEYRSSKYSLSNRYLNLEIDPERIGKFAIALGATIHLVPEKSPCFWNPSWDDKLSNVAGKRRTSSCIDEDYKIEGLGEVLETPSIEISSLIWKTMYSLPDTPNYLVACYQKNEANGSRSAPSQLVHTLKNTSWIPQISGNFVKPLDASAEMLPEGFRYDPSQRWLSDVEFGRSSQKKEAKRRSELELANKLGITLEDADFIKKHKEAFNLFKENKNREAANRQAVENSDSGNIERRRQKNIERLKKAPTKNSTKRARSVRAYSKSEYDGHALLDYYFNVEEDQPFCQICCDTMPFINQRDEVFVEYVDLLSKRWADHVGVQLPVMTDLKLVLCPVCSEIYQQYIHKDIEAQKRLISYLLEDHEDDFIICDRQKGRDGKDNILRFDQKHLDGIRVCLESLTPLADSSRT